MLLMLLAFAAMPISPALAAAITAIAVDGHKVTLSFDGAIGGAQGTILFSPWRLALDIPGAAPGTLGGDLYPSNGTISGSRIMRYRPGVTRIVFDLVKPSLVRVAKLAADGRTLTLKLASASPAEYGRAVLAGRTSYGGAIAVASLAPPLVAASGRGNVSVALPDAGPYRLPIPIVQGRADKPLVVIDAGHGGHDPGSLSIDGRYREKDAALAIARAVRDELLASGRVRVALTRSDDRFLILDERREIARRLKADLFISIHADSAPGSSARGATVYTLSETSSDRVAARLAAKENKADVLNGVNLDAQTNDVSSILIDLTQRETMNTSSRFADLLQHELTGEGVDFKSTYHRFAGLVVLKAPDVPAVLLETGYMSSDDDLRLLFSKDYQHHLAIGVTHAVEAHFARRLGQTAVASAE